ncbi:MAG: hypothetical protein ABH805_00505 [Candidatus Nealsonbacteria bacterium]
MRIKDSPNLKYDKTSSIASSPQDYDKVEFNPKNCVLESYERTDDIFNLKFKNGTRAKIEAKNDEGGREVDVIDLKLPDFINHSYEEILEYEF